MKLYPALDVCAPPDAVLVAVDDFSPTAVEERESALRVFFASPDARDAACAELRASGFDTTPLDVSDEDWARRSQDNLPPICVGRITVYPQAHAPTDPGPASEVRLKPDATGITPRRVGLKPDAFGVADPSDDIAIVIQPSMGFGTGHHATTRLCLEALQTLDLAGAFVLDVGTGSGILAIAADRLGAARAVGIDIDEDAVQSARENLTLNPAARRVSIELADLETIGLPIADVITANLTGALLERTAPGLMDAVRSGGSLVLSGILAEERDAVVRAFARGAVVWEKQDAEWVGLVMKKS